MVEAVLESLTACVNLSTGLAHLSDKSTAVQAFRVLRDGGEVQPYGGVRLCDTDRDRKTHANSPSWAQRILEGRPIPGGRPHWRREFLNTGGNGLGRTDRSPIMSGAKPKPDPEASTHYWE